jgi:L-iditol 2-dehydrogenase
VRALRAVEAGAKKIRLCEIADKGELAGGEVMVATRAVGVCGSDIHAWHGTQSYPMKYPVTLGHEAVGVVERVAPGTGTVVPGTRVVSETARTVCGTCFSCRQGHYNLCPERLGFGALYDGAMADAFVSRADILHAVPDGVSDVVAAVTEPYCVAFNAVVECARIRPGDVVAVVGPGPIGVFAAEVSLLAGASEVRVAGVPGDEARLKLAEAMGCSTLMSDGTWWENAGLASSSDVVIDSSGVSATLEAALSLVRPGGQVVKVGWGPQPYGRPLDMLVAKAVQLHGSFSHTWSTWERVLRLLGKGRLQPSRALCVYDFADWETAFSAMADRTALKAVLKL